MKDAKGNDGFRVGIHCRVSIIRCRTIPKRRRIRFGTPKNDFAATLWQRFWQHLPENDIKREKGFRHAFAETPFLFWSYESGGQGSANFLPRSKQRHCHFPRKIGHFVVLSPSHVSLLSDGLSDFSALSYRTITNNMPGYVWSWQQA